MPTIAFRYDAIGFAYEGFGLQTSSVMFGVAPEFAQVCTTPPSQLPQCHAEQTSSGGIYVMSQLDSQSSTFVAGVALTPRGGIRIPNVMDRNVFPTQLVGKILRLEVPGEVSFGGRNKFKIQVMSNDGRMTELYSYEAYHNGISQLSGDIAFEGILSLPPTPSMRPQMLDYVFGY
jgi:hypothetical protein